MQERLGNYWEERVRPDTSVVCEHRDTEIIPMNHPLDHFAQAGLQGGEPHVFLSRRTESTCSAESSCGDTV